MTTQRETDATGARGMRKWSVNCVGEDILHVLAYVQESLEDHGLHIERRYNTFKVTAEGSSPICNAIETALASWHKDNPDHRNGHIKQGGILKWHIRKASRSSRLLGWVEIKPLG